MVIGATTVWTINCPYQSRSCYRAGRFGRTPLGIESRDVQQCHTDIWQNECVQWPPGTEARGAPPLFSHCRLSTPPSIVALLVGLFRYTAKRPTSLSVGIVQNGGDFGEWLWATVKSPGKNLTWKCIHCVNELLWLIFINGVTTTHLITVKQ